MRSRSSPRAAAPRTASASCTTTRRIGFPEFWLLDPEARTLERLVLREGVYSIVEALEGDVVFHPDSFHELEIDLGRLWREPEEA